MECIGVTLHTASRNTVWTLVALPASLWCWQNHKSGYVWFCVSPHFWIGSCLGEWCTLKCNECFYFCCFCGYQLNWLYCTIPSLSTGSYIQFTYHTECACVLHLPTTWGSFCFIRKWTISGISGITTLKTQTSLILDNTYRKGSETEINSKHSPHLRWMLVMLSTETKQTNTITVGQQHCSVIGLPIL